MLSSAIWEIFYEFPIFATYFTNLQASVSKVWETNKVFVNIAQGYSGITSLLACHYVFSN